MPSKSSDSSKKSKKSDKDGNSGPNKKLKRSSSVETGSDSKSKNSSTSKDGKKQQQPPQEQAKQAITMTIPRKRDKLEMSATIPKKSSKSSSTADQQKQASATPIPKIPKKSASQSKSSNVSSDKESKSKTTKESKSTKASKATEKSQGASEKASKTSGDKSSKSSSKTSSKSTDKGTKEMKEKISIDAENAAEKVATTPKDSEAKPPKLPEKESATIEEPLKPAESLPKTVEADSAQGSGSDNSASNAEGNESKSDDSASNAASTSEAEETVTSSNYNQSSGDKPSSGSTSSGGAPGRRTSLKSQASDDKNETGSSGTPKPPKIDTTMVDGDQQSAQQAAAPNKAKSPTPTAMDNHPYARGSVIEVLHGVSDEAAGDAWWSEDSDEEEEGESDGDDANNNSSGKSHKKSSVRLCDVIDRVSIGDKQWRYYVHYRDFNRRMDEWVAMKRIVSPPSVGNAKARAIKKEEEKQKRKQQRIEERNAELSAAVDVTAPRASRRRSSMQNPTAAASTNTAATAAAAAGDTPAAEGDSETPRRTRLQRKKSNVEDDATVVATNVASGRAGGETGQSTPPPPAVIAAEKGIVAIPTTAAATHTVGEHVVATIPAQELDEHEGLDEASLREHEEVTKVKNVAFVELGPYQMETWYFSPLPKELLSEKGFIEVLYVCEFTFSLFSRKSELQRFQSRLPTHLRHPPGNEIYRNGNLAMFEIDGFQERIYCQNLCYIAKLFLDHKTLYFDVDPFLFYVLCEVDNRGFHPVGYYSKEKYSDVGYNLACILTFPSHQRKGYGRFLIAFSYELSKKEEKVGSPEKPMSDLGQQAYKPYWNSTIVDFLLNQSSDSSSMSIMDISKQTSIMAEDIVFTLNQLGILKIINGVYFVSAHKELLEKLAKKFPVKNPKVDPSKLHWTPFATDVKRDKFSIHSKKPSVEGEETRGSGGFP